MISSRFKALLQGFNCNDPFVTQTPVFYGVGKPGKLQETPTAIRGFFELLTMDLPQARDYFPYTFSPVSEVFYIAFPKVWGGVKSIYDENGFLISADWVTKDIGLICQSATKNYTAYEFKNITTRVATSITFKFSSNLTHIK